MRRIYIACYYEQLDKHCSWIGHNAQIRGIPVFPHGIVNIFISGGACIGENVVIFQNVTIGSNSLKDSRTYGAPMIGNNCYIGAGANIIGNVTVGDNCRIGAGTTVARDVPPNSVVVSKGVTIIHKENMDNRYNSYSPVE